ncbi:peptidoglycan synthase ftsI [Enterobacter cloacae]|uniref:Peptidoglycan synthase ftsI n=1 Tax=Enterobacter cloacae TaxID=550 RepID=A0A377M094_ENTCL|nr:peptidoglycan synthase ftsI [Enterobacter cloacae]
MRSLREVAIDAPRGMIMDREGRPLAVSVPVRAVWADPKNGAGKRWGWV